MTVQCSPASWTPVKSKKELREKLNEGIRKVEFMANTGGDGCQTRPSHTSAYWSRLHSEMGDEAYDDMIERMEQHEAMGGAVY
jgi:hypothetical protein